MNDGNRSPCFLMLVVLSLFALPANALESKLTQGGFHIGQVEAGSKVFYQDKEVRQSKRGQFVIGFGRDAELKQSFTVVDKNGQQQVVRIRLTPRAYKIQKITGVDKKYVTPPDDLLDRIRNDNRMIKAARAYDTEREDFFKGLSRPAVGRTTGVYGSQRYFNGEPRRPHFGMDIAGPVGAKVTAVANGIVRLSEPDLYFSGGTIVIDHGFGLSTTYIHLSKIKVKNDQLIKRGENIGEIGATGRVTGPHLDWRVNWFDVRMDPELMLLPQS